MNKDIVKYLDQISEAIGHISAIIKGTPDDAAVATPAAPAIARKRRKKDPNAPKRPLSSYMQWSILRRTELSKEHPDWSQKDIARHLGVEWKALSADDKHPYERKYAEDMEVYRTVLEDYMHTQSGSPASVPSDGSATEDAPVAIATTATSSGVVANTASTPSTTGTVIQSSLTTSAQPALVAATTSDSHAESQPGSEKKKRKHKHKSHKENAGSEAAGKVPHSPATTGGEVIKKKRKKKHLHSRPNGDASPAPVQHQA